MEDSLKVRHDAAPPQGARRSRSRQSSPGPRLSSASPTARPASPRHSCLAEEEANMVTWLSNKLRTERAVFLIHLEERHEKLVEAFDLQFPVDISDSPDRAITFPKTSRKGAAPEGTSMESAVGAALLPVFPHRSVADDKPRSSTLVVPGESSAEFLGNSGQTVRKSNLGQLAPSLVLPSTRTSFQEEPPPLPNSALGDSSLLPRPSFKEEPPPLPDSATVGDGRFDEADGKVSQGSSPLAAMQLISTCGSGGNDSRPYSSSKLSKVKTMSSTGADWPQFQPDETRSRASVVSHVLMKHLRSKTRLLVPDDRRSQSWIACDRFERFVKSQSFEAVFAMAILLNALLMSFDLQYQGLQVGFDLSYQAYREPADELWPGAKEFFDGSEVFFAVVFMLELIMRIAAYRKKAFLICWIYIDFIILVLVFVPMVIKANLRMMNPTVVRLLRFGKLMKIVRLMRTSVFMSSLKLLVASIQASVNTLFWSLCVLMLIQTFAGMLISYILLEYLEDSSHDVENRRQVFGYFGTFWRSMITMFEIIFGNWGPICRLLLEAVDEAYGLFFIGYRCIIGFACVAVIQAVFIQQTMKTAALDDQLCLEQKNSEKAKFVARLQRVFNELDQNGDGVLSWDEFEPMMEDERLQGLMHTLEVSPQDVEGLFKELDDGDGEISTEEFLKGITCLRGGAKAMDCVKILNISRRLEAKLDTLSCNRKATYDKVWKSERMQHSIRSRGSRRPQRSKVEVESAVTRAMATPGQTA